MKRLIAAIISLIGPEATNSKTITAMNIMGNDTILFKNDNRFNPNSPLSH